jgi:hypothetical protein
LGSAVLTETATRGCIFPNGWLCGVILPPFFHPQSLKAAVVVMVVVVLTEAVATFFHRVL